MNHFFPHNHWYRHLPKYFPPESLCINNLCYPRLSTAGMDHFEMHARELWGCVTLRGWRWRGVVCCCEQGNELLCSIKGRNSWPTEEQLLSRRPCTVGISPPLELLGMPLQLSPSACLQGKRPSLALHEWGLLTSWSRHDRETNSCSACHRIPSVLWKSVFYLAVFDVLTGMLMKERLTGSWWRCILQGVDVGAYCRELMKVHIAGSWWRCVLQGVDEGAYCRELM